jgi:hypothetical protein
VVSRDYFRVLRIRCAPDGRSTLATPNTGGAWSSGGRSHAATSQPPISRRSIVIDMREPVGAWLRALPERATEQSS